ncbi:unnamed protein product [Rotaria socialis]
MNLSNLYFLFCSIIINTCYAGPLEDLSSMPDLTLFYQQLIRQPDLQALLQDAYQSQQPGSVGEYTIFAPNNDAMARINRRNENPTVLWKYHIVPGRYDDQTIFSMAEEKFNQANPRQMGTVRPQNNLPTMSLPFQVFYGIGFYGGTGPYINVSYDNTGYNTGGVPWLPRPTHAAKFDNLTPLNPYLVNLNNYNPSQPTQNYVVAQGSASSSNPNLFPKNLTNYYANVFNPNVNTQFLQNINPPPNNNNNNNNNPNVPQQPGFGLQGGFAGIGIPRPTINNAFILQSRLMSRGIINVVDNILWPPERRDQVQYKTAFDALEDAQFSRLRQLAQRSEYFRAELRSMNHQTFFLPNDQAFASLGANAEYLLEQSLRNNTNDVNEFVKSHIIPIVLYPSVMDASKQLSTLNLGKWVTFRKLIQSDQSFEIDVVSNRQVARILISRSEDIKIYGNGLVYPIPIFLSGVTRSAADELARSYQYFMALIQQSGDTELVNLLQGNTAGLGNTGPTIFNPDNTIKITVLIPQRIAVQQLGNSEELSKNLRRHILRLPVYTDQLSPTSNAFVQTGPMMPQFQRSSSNANKKLPRRHRRRRRQVNMPSNMNYQQQQNVPSQPRPPTQQQAFPMQQQNLPVQQQAFPMQQQHRNSPNQQQNFPMQQQNVPFQQQQGLSMQQQQPNPPVQQQQQQAFLMQQQQPNLPVEQKPVFPMPQQQQPNIPIQQQQHFSMQQQQQQQQQNTLVRQQQQPQQNTLVQQQQQQMLPSRQQEPDQQQKVLGKQQLLPIDSQQMLPNQQFFPVQEQPMFPNQQQPMLPNQQQPMLPNQQQPMFPNQQQPMLPNQQQPMLPNQQQPMFPNQQQPMLPNQQQPIFPNQQQPMLPNQQQPMFPNQQQPMLPNPQQPMFPNQQQPMLPNQQQPMFPNQQQPMLPNPQQPMLPNQQLLPSLQDQLNPTLNPSYYQMPPIMMSAVFQDGQMYPTMDPQFFIQAQVATGPSGNVIRLIGRPENSLPFIASVLNNEANIPIKNGVMHVIRGLLSGTVIPLDTILSTMQGASSFTQLLEQTGVLNQLKQSGRPYTLFIPTNAALQFIGVATDINKIRQFVLRHVCADVIMDPMTNILRRAGGYYSRGQAPRAQPQQQQKPAQRRNRRKRQDWADAWRNGSMTVGGQPVKAPDLGAAYFEPQEQVYGGYPAAPSPYGFYNQLYNPAYVMGGYANPNSQYYPYSNGSSGSSEGFNYQNSGVLASVPMSDANWNQTFGAFYNPQLNVVPMTGSGGDPSYYTGTGGFYSGSTYATGPQSCMAMTGERITVQPLAGAQTGGINEAVDYQNFMVTCCGDQSVNAIVQSFNVYPPSFAVYIIGRSLLSYGQTINTMFSHTTTIFPCQLFVFALLTLLIFMKYV